MAAKAISRTLYSASSNSEPSSLKPKARAMSAISWSCSLSSLSNISLSNLSISNLRTDSNRSISNRCTDSKWREDSKYRMLSLWPYMALRAVTLLYSLAGNFAMVCGAGEDFFAIVLLEIFYCFIARVKYRYSEL